MSKQCPVDPAFEHRFSYPYLGSCVPKDLSDRTGESRTRSQKLSDRLNPRTSTQDSSHYEWDGGCDRHSPAASMHRFTLAWSDLAGDVPSQFRVEVECVNVSTCPETDGLPGVCFVQHWVENTSPDEVLLFAGRVRFNAVVQVGALWENEPVIVRVQDPPVEGNRYGRIGASPAERSLDRAVKEGR